MTKTKTALCIQRPVGFTARENTGRWNYPRHITAGRAKILVAGGDSVAWLCRCSVYGHSSSSSDRRKHNDADDDTARRPSTKRTCLHVITDDVISGLCSSPSSSSGVSAYFCRQSNSRLSIYIYTWILLQQAICR